MAFGVRGLPVYGFGAFSGGGRRKRHAIPSNYGKDGQYGRRHPERRTPNAKRLVRQNLRKKLAGTVCLRILKKGLPWPVFDYFATVHEDNSIGDPFGKTHLMSDH